MSCRPGDAQGRRFVPHTTMSAPSASRQCGGAQCVAYCTARRTHSTVRYSTVGWRSGTAQVVSQVGGAWHKYFLRRLPRAPPRHLQPCHHHIHPTTPQSRMNFPSSPNPAAGAGAGGMPPAMGGPQDPNVKAVRLAAAAAKHTLTYTRSLSHSRAHIKHIHTHIIHSTRTYRARIRWKADRSHRSKRPWNPVSENPSCRA